MGTPFSSEPTRLALDDVKLLISTRRFAPTPRSPFGFISASGEPVTAASIELAPEVEQALTILEDPDARLKISSWRRGQRPAQVILFRRGDQAAPGGFDRESLFVGRPIGVPTLVDYLVSQLASQPLSTEHRDLLVAPRALVGISWLWSYGQRSAADSVRAQDIETRLAQSRIEDPQALLAELVEAGILERAGGELRLGREWVPWLSRIWSAEYVEVEASLLPKERMPTSAELAAARKRMLFVGPSGERLLLQAVPDRQLDLTAATERARSEEAPLAFSLLSDEELRGFLLDLIGAETGDTHENDSISS